MQSAYYGILAVGAVVGLLWGALAPVPGDRRLLFRTAALPALPAISLWLFLVNPDGLRFPVYDVDKRDWTGFFPVACVSWIGSLAGVALGVLCRRGAASLRKLLASSDTTPLVPLGGPGASIAQASPPSRLEGRPTEFLVVLSAGLFVTCVASLTLEVIHTAFAEGAGGVGRGPCLALSLLPPSAVVLGALAIALLRVQWGTAMKVYRVAALFTAILLVIAVRCSHARATPSNVSWYSELLGSLYVLVWVGGLFGVCSLVVLFRAARHGDGPTWTLALVLLGQAWTLATNGSIAVDVSDIHSPRAKDRLLIAGFREWVESLFADQMLVLILGLSLWMGALVVAQRATPRPSASPRV